MKPAPQKYRTTNWKTYNEALKARGSLLIWLDPVMKWHGRPSGRRGRSPTFSDEAIQFCLSIKCLFNLPLRQAMRMTQSLLHLAGRDWPVPDYSTVSRRQKTLQVAIGAVPTTTGLHLLVDSTGIKMLGEGEWKTKKHGADYRRQWRKAHLGIDASTREIRGRAIWKRWSGYHRRSLVETKMRCCKLLGERVMARDFDRQVAELQVRAAVLNRFTRLGTPVTVPVL